MVTPHLPPHQAANALFPHLLGDGLRARGHDVDYLTFADGTVRPDAARVRRRGRRLGALRLPQALEAAETWWKARALLDRAQLVHVHSSTWMNQVAARLAKRRRRPYLVTHYGTEIWHHDGRDRRFRRFNHDARHVTFYSRALLARAVELGVPLQGSSVVYPPVADGFHPLDPAERAEVRRRFVGNGGGSLLLNVKRLHPLADQATLVGAFAEVRRARPNAVLLLAGRGEEEEALKRQAAGLGLGDSVRFLGLVPNPDVARLQAAADLFVLSSVLEATPTVALEALACGTPVVSSDSPGGIELAELFGDDVALVRKRDAGALAAAVLDFLAAPRRARDATLARIAGSFRLPGVVDAYLRLYREATAA